MAHSLRDFRAKDFIETKESLIFAVVENGTEQGRVLCFLRYRKTSEGWQKLTTHQANTLLENQYPEYLYYSLPKDAYLHAVPVEKIDQHFFPEKQLQVLLQCVPHDSVLSDLQQLCHLLIDTGLAMEQIGITGSLLINAQKKSSDIDLVFYDRDDFFQARNSIRKLIITCQLHSLSEADWRVTYQRRGCELSFSEYVWHEQRKFNKAVINQRKFDLSFVGSCGSLDIIHFKKIGPVKIQALVTDDSRGFDYPAVLEIDDAQIQVVVSFTATYTGQAFTGEKVEIAGLLEQASNGCCRIVVGSTREAENEYIKVLQK